LPAGFNKNLAGEGSKKTIKEWQQLGVTGKGVAGKPDLRAYLVQPIAVGTLADRIAVP